MMKLLARAVFLGSSAWLHVSNGAASEPFLSSGQADSVSEIISQSRQENRRLVIEQKIRIAKMELADREDEIVDLKTLISDMNGFSQGTLMGIVKWRFSKASLLAQETKDALTNFFEKRLVVREDVDFIPEMEDRIKPIVLSRAKSGQDSGEVLDDIHSLFSLKMDALDQVSKAAGQRLVDELDAEVGKLMSTSSKMRDFKQIAGDVVDLEVRFARAKAQSRIIKWKLSQFEDLLKHTSARLSHGLASSRD